MLKIISLGNELRGDDGIGPRVLEQLTKIKHPIPIRFINAGADAFIILEHLVDSDPVLLIDCAKMGKTPGSVNKFNVRETNPVFVLSGSFLLFIILKFGINGFLFYKIMNPFKMWFRQYTMILVALFLIIGQFIGLYSNIHAYNLHNEDLNNNIQNIAAEQNKSELSDKEIEIVTEEYLESISLPKEEAIKLYNQLVIPLLLYPMFMALLSFILWLSMGEYDGKTKKNS